jgi:putative MATE family efflux protein
MASDSATSTAPGRGGARGTDLTTGSVVRHLVRFSIPMLMGSTLQTAYAIINALWVGNRLGAEAMAAITVSFPIFFLLMAVAGGLTLASNILVSQAYGAKDWVRLKQIIQNSVLLTGIFGVACVVVGYFAAEAVLRAMGTPPDVLPVAVGYLRIFLWTTPFMFGIFFLAAVMRGVGDSRTPLYFQAGSLVLTAVLDPLLMFGWLGLPRLGLNGTAVATICAQFCAFVSIAVYIQWRGHIAAPDWRHLRVDGATTWLTLKIGVPTMVQQALVSIGMLFIIGMVNRFGSHATAAYGIAMRIDQIAFMPAMAIGMAVSTLAGQNIGARRFDRVHEVFRWGVVVSCGITMLASVLAIALPAQLIGLFTPDADVVVTGAYYLRVVGAGYLMFAVMFVSNGVVNGAGHTAATTVFTLVGFWAVRVPLAAYLSGRLGRVEGIWYAVLVSLAAGTVVSLGYYLSGRWQRPILKRRVPPTLAPSVEIEL